MIAVLQLTLAEQQQPAQVHVESHAPNWYAVTLGEAGVQIKGDPAALLATLQGAIDKINQRLDWEGS